jgi:transglutaminase-like putative cysteine protease
MSQLKGETYKQDWFQSLLLLGLITLLFWEWLRPLLVLTDTRSIGQFLWFFIIVMFIKALRLPWIASVLLIGFTLIYMIHHLYIAGPFFSKEWIIYVRDHLFSSFSLLLERNLDGHSFIVRTSLFFVLVGYVATYLYSISRSKKGMFSYFILTILFLAIIDTFSPFDARYSIFRTVIIGFGLLAITQITRVLDQVSSGTEKNKVPFPYPWLSTSIALVILFTSVAFILPKASPSWPDPVTFLKGYSESVGGGAGFGTVRKIGYGDNDQFLGGPFIMDDTLVFTAQSEARHYWRGETKDVYTGRGWTQSAETTQFSHPDDIQESIAAQGMRIYEEEVEKKEIFSGVRYAELKYANIFYPGDIISLDVSPQSQLVNLEASSGKITIWKNEREASLVREYGLLSEYPIFSTVTLREATLDDLSEEMREQYTQLPDSLPERIGVLAQDVTENHDSLYDKVKEVEGFFRRYGYLYETEDVPVPGRDEDYVDQFIFETKRGYCDNFSSAMVVMLRSIDIPARWVKGFTAGETLARGTDTITTEIRNKNAHSWVEVYFPGIGWVPFEPTRSFSSPFVFERDDLETSESTPTDPLFDPLQDELEELSEEERDIDIDTISSTYNINDGWFNSTKIALMLSIIMASIVTFAFVFRKNLILSWAIVRYRGAEDGQWVIKAYELLIRYLGRFVMKKEPSQTMREYVLTLEPKFESAELRPLTRMFEDIRYGMNKGDKTSIQKAYSMWAAVLKKMRS